MWIIVNILTGRSIVSLSCYSLALFVHVCATKMKCSSIYIDSEKNGEIFVLFIHGHIYYGYSLKVPRIGTSYEYLQYMHCIFFTETGKKKKKKKKKKKHYVGTLSYLELCCKCICHI